MLIFHCERVAQYSADYMGTELGRLVVRLRFKPLSTCRLVRSFGLVLLKPIATERRTLGV